MIAGLCRGGESGKTGETERENKGNQGLTECSLQCSKMLVQFLQPFFCGCHDKCEIAFGMIIEGGLDVYQNYYFDSPKWHYWFPDMGFNTLTS